MEVWQHMELTGTNKPCGLAIFYFTVALDLFCFVYWGQHHNIQLSKFIYIPLYADGCKAAGAEKFMLFGGHSESVTPVPIPNTEVKPLSADGTAREAWWESRSPPILFCCKTLPLKRKGFFLPS